jgi:outer membrane protein assembly factor BamA
VWNIHERSDVDGNILSEKFQFKNFLREIAVGTGIGLRYDLDFLVLRLDWGIGLHVPYETSKSGFFNTDGFKKNQTLHFAIGYPF